MAILIHDMCRSRKAIAAMFHVRDRAPATMKASVVGETLCYIFHTKNGTHTNVIRPFNVYGPGMQETDYRVLPNFASRVKAGQALKVYGTGNQTRTFCYITDAMVGFYEGDSPGCRGRSI